MDKLNLYRVEAAPTPSTGWTSAVSGGVLLGGDSPLRGHHCLSGQAKNGATELDNALTEAARALPP